MKAMFKGLSTFIDNSFNKIQNRIIKRLNIKMKIDK